MKLARKIVSLRVPILVLTLLLLFDRLICATTLGMGHLNRNNRPHSGNRNAGKKEEALV